jgi:tetratricopeptide (TPR) repeat protein
MRGRRRGPTTAILGSAASLLLSLILTTAARAQPAPDPAPPEESPAQPAPLSPDEAKALALYQEGDRRYAEGRYEEAVDLFKQAYELSPQPLLLFNLANSYERLAAYADAAEALAGYIDSGQADDIDTLRQRLHQIRQRAAVAARREREIAALRERPTSCPAAVCPVDSEEPDRSDRTAYVLFASGGAAMVSAVVFGVLARSAGNDAEQQCVSADGRRLCSSEAQDALDRQRQFALFTDVSAGLGLAAIGAGAYFYWRHRSDEKRKKRVGLAPSVVPGAWGIGVAGSF